MTDTPRRLRDFKERNLKEEKSAKGWREIGMDKVTGHPDTKRGALRDRREVRSH